MSDETSVWRGIGCLPTDSTDRLAHGFTELVRTIARQGSQIDNPWIVIEHACAEMLGGIRACASTSTARAFLFVFAVQENEAGIWWRVIDSPMALTRDVAVAGHGWRFVANDVCYNCDAAMFFVEGHWAFGFGEEYQSDNGWAWSSTLEHALAVLRQQKGTE